MYKLCFYILKLFQIAAGVKGRVSFACDGVKMHISSDITFNILKSSSSESKLKFIYCYTL